MHARGVALMVSAKLQSLLSPSVQEHSSQPFGREYLLHVKMDKICNIKRKNEQMCAVARKGK